MARVLYMTVLSIAFLILVSPFSVSIIFGGSVALALFPLILKLESKGLSRKKSAAILTILFTVLISIPISFFIAKGIVTVTGHLEKINFNEQLRDQGMQGFVSDVRHDIVLSVHKYAQKVNVGEFLTPKKIDGYLNVITTWLLRFFQGFLMSLPVMFVFILITVLCTYSFLKNAASVRHFFQRIFGFDDETMSDLVAIAIRDARDVYVSNIVTAAVQALCVALGASLTGTADFFLVFFVTLILAFIPIVGAGPVAFACGLLAYIKGDSTSAIILVVVGLFAGTIDNIIRPWLATIGESNIPQITAFIAVLGGALLMGFPGLFIGLLVGSFAYDTLPIFWREMARGDKSYVEDSVHGP